MKRTLSVLLSAFLMLNASVPAVFAETYPDTAAETVESAAEETAPLEHAYDPIAEAEAEQAYRESVNFTAGKVVFAARQYRQDGVKFGFLNDASPMLDGTGLKNVTYLMDFESDTADEREGFTAYDVYYEAETSEDVWLTVDTLKAIEGIISAEPDFIWNTSNEGDAVTVSGDEIKTAWFLDNDVHDIKNVWDKYFTLKAPGSGTVVAVIDTGVDYTHKDLAANMWVNDGEIAENGIDDDGNGYVDDVYGADFIENDCDPMDDMGHGTHVAGIIAMPPGNGGGVGVAYGAKIMAIKAGQATGSFTSTDIAKAITYAKANGADVINMSFGGTGKSTLVETALKDAFGKCVLVASAGNDGLPTYDGGGVDIYPAGYTYVLGVMAEDASGNLADFSNWDYIIGKNCEYEIAAPGVGIYSTLPNNKYALWSGTSMAAPMISAEAAILRSYYPDKNYYTNRYIMGQIVSATEDRCGAYPSMNIFDSIYKQPKPDLKITEVYTLDKEYIDSENNNGNGIIQSGETVDLAFSVFNRWGIAGDVKVTADAHLSGYEQTGLSNPYVEFITDTAELDNVGTFATVNNGYTYENDELVSVSKPIRINIKDTAPNDAEIAINLTLTAKNDMDKTDHTVYTYNAIYTFRVQKGHALSGVINEDMTLTADEYWIIENSVLIPEGVTVTVEPGTQIQFWPENDLAPYGTTARAYINVEGKMECRGTEEKPINIFPGKGHENDGVLMFGNIDFYYTYLMNPYDIFNSQGLYNYGFSASLLDHCVIIQNSIESFQVIDDSTFKFLGHIGASEINKCIFRYLTPEAQVIDLPTFVSGSMNCSLMEKCSESFCVNTLRNNVFLFNYPVAGTFGTDNLVMMFDNFAFKNNAVLNNLNDYSGDSWMSISGYPGGPDIDISENYWGTTNENLIKRQVFDKDYEVSYSDLIQEPWLTLESESLSEIYPFVTRAYLTDKDGNEITTVSGSQEVTFHVLFNRDMASDIQPSVGFGGSEPFTDYTVMGDWVSDREWQGTMVIDPFINQGRMYMRVQGAAAADDKWLVTGDDHERFFFEVTKSDAQSMALQGAGLPGKTMLSWYQDDFETLAGYNIYRSKSYDKEKNAVEQSFVKLNTSVIANGEETYTDENVEEGKDYYYYFTVMDTDFNESAPSNVVKCTPLDGTLPVIVHEPITKLEKGKSFGVRADVTDNVGVDKVTVWYKNANEEQWQSETMDKISGNSYFVRISANEMSEGTMQYYIAASDGLNTAYFGTENEPLEFVVGDIENTTETTTETTTEATSETSTETTSEVSTETESQKQDDNFLFGDANADGKLLAEDAAFILQKVLNNSFVLEIEKRTSNFKHYIDVDADGAINASDAVEVLQKVLNNSYRMTIERRKENEHQ